VDLHPLIVVAGPTGSGKSALGLILAEHFGGEIASCDSVQIYRHFDIASAKVAPQERRGIPHHLMDIADPDETFTAGDYTRAARGALASITARGRVPIVIGGTGFYLRALLEGLFEGPGRDEALRQRLLHREALRPGALHRILSRLDPESAARIHQHDINKLTRALEVRLLTRHRLSELFQRPHDSLAGYRTLKLGLNPPREDLYARLNARAKAMFEGGLLEETRRILDLGYSRQSKPFESLGYLQALQVLDGEITIEQAVEATQLHTRRYAKRQWTWFRRDAEIRWLDGFGDDPLVQHAACEKVAAFLPLPEKKFVS
jgi:tRNA dimethylallyltransferase